MPIIENSQVFDNHDEIDDCFLVKRLSLYATIRPEDIKSLGADPGLTKTPRGSRGSLQDLFRPTRDLRHDLAITEERGGSSSSLESVCDDTPVINGRDFPIQYKSAGIRPHEFPVIGKDLLLSNDLQSIHYYRNHFSKNHAIHFTSVYFLLFPFYEQIFCLI